MRKKINFSLLIITFVFTNVLSNSAQESKRIISSQSTFPHTDTWTKDQIQYWKDSLRQQSQPFSPLSSYSKSSASSDDNVLMSVMSASEDVTFSNTYVPNTYAISKTMSVGEIPVETSVTPSGVLACQVPIEIYPGIRGFQPQLSLAYNHHAGNGVMGVGWNVAGLSCISRTTKNLYYDGKTDGVKMNKDDAFHLDGMRLIKLNETADQIT